ncbi:MAG: hypothetical protein EOO26_13065 [Comamonadaceae bacterium]|nr:MAG: hypothetical protein EOO26_13065 [Comamonadaceae bacterium]
MVDAGFAQYGSRAGEQLHGLATQTLQLLAMLEVVHSSRTQDANYIAELASAMAEFTVRTRETELMLPLDPGARSRECLQVSVDKAHVLYRAALHMARISPDDASSVHATTAKSLHRLVSVCERLHEVVRKHDRPFESGDAPGSQQALA